LLSLVALGTAYAYFAERRVWVRCALVGLMVPIAILTNAIRIATSCLLGYNFRPGIC
jgi:exosortase/archaeosortase family protein